MPALQDSAAREGHRAAAPVPVPARASGVGAGLRALGKARGLTLAGLLAPRDLNMEARR